MKLEVQTLWSADVDPPSGGMPTDVEDFNVGVQVSLGEVGQPGGEVFSFTACSPSALGRTGDGRFISHTLLITAFDWVVIKARIEKLLLHVSSCESWAQAIQRLSPFLRHDDAG